MKTLGKDNFFLRIIRKCEKMVHGWKTWLSIRYSGLIQEILIFVGWIDKNIKIEFGKLQKNEQNTLNIDCSQKVMTEQ